MSLDLKKAALVNNVLTNALEAFTDMQMPGKSTKNSEQAAWDLLLSQRMKAYAEAFNKKAVAEAVKAGVLFDHSKSPKPAGVDEDIYAGDFVRVTLKTKKGSTRVDMAMLQYHLVNGGTVTDAMWEAALAKATKENAAPHTFTASLRT